jgi:cell division protein FtsZ
LFQLTELNQNGVIKYSLEEYMEVENDLLNSKPFAKLEEPIEESLNFTMKVAEPTRPTYATHSEDLSPMEMTIEETLKLRADERRRKLKEFNYKFHNNPSRIEELEKEPAYKRLGVDLTENQNHKQNSRMSLGTDSNDDIQLRSNNSFLHDNVD